MAAAANLARSAETPSLFNHSVPSLGAQSLREVIRWPRGACAARKLDCVSGLGVLGCQLAACNDHEVLRSLFYLIVRCLLGVPAVLLRRDLSKDAELLVLRHENAVLHR